MTGNLPIAAGDLLLVLPTALYATDADGRITFFNREAVRLWGVEPVLGETRWCGAWRLYDAEGALLPHDRSPLAETLRGGEPVRGVELVAERPDGSWVPFVSYPALLRDASGRVAGAVSQMIDISDRQSADMDLERLAAIVSSSEDAIVSKTLDGTIMTWNAGATRIFGYEAEEMIGRSVLTIVPPELHAEEADILARLSRGERIEHFDTIRVAKDGRRLNISLTVSPVRDRRGVIVGASKVARDITERKRSEEFQQLLFNELNHRVKNTLTIVQAVATQSLRRAPDPGRFVSSFSGRIQALARAHDVLVHGMMHGAQLAELIRDQLILGDGSRTIIEGPAVLLNSQMAVQLALVIHELATNARKYGALSADAGRLHVSWTLEAGRQRRLLIAWRESGVRGIRAPATHGFGTTLIEQALQGHDGTVTISYRPDGLVCDISLPLPESGEIRPLMPTRAPPAETAATPPDQTLAGVRVLLVEDEPIVAMEMEAQLTGAGCVVVGPAGYIDRAMTLIGMGNIDVALLDANLNGRPVDEIAAALTAADVPFVFTTGYERSALPRSFQGAELLRKPFSEEQLLAAIAALAERRGTEGAVPLRPKTG
ncbi:MAG: PAS domain S-box protein [Bauldia sp.]